MKRSEESFEDNGEKSEAHSRDFLNNLPEIYSLGFGFGVSWISKTFELMIVGD